MRKTTALINAVWLLNAVSAHEHGDAGVGAKVVGAEADYAQRHVRCCFLLSTRGACGL